MRFDHPGFFNGYRKHFGSLSQQQVNGLTILLDHIEADPHVTRIEWASYMLATVKRETANTFMPIHEYGSHSYFVGRYGSQTAVGKRLGNKTAEDGALYAGEGDVQLTGKGNFEKAEDAVREQYPEIVEAFEQRTGRKFDLTVGDQPNDIDDPKNAQDPDIAYAIMSYGMRTGMFTGRKLSATGSNYTAWRGIINGTDHAAEIAADAVAFEKILRDCFLDGETQPVVLHTLNTASQSNGNGQADTQAPSGDSDASKSVETPAEAMPQPVAPPPTTQQTSDIQVSDSTTAVAANSKAGFLSKFLAFVMLVVTGQATVPEFVTNGLSSASFWQVIVNIFQNLWTFRKWILLGLIAWFVVYKIEHLILKLAAIHTNSDPTKGNVVLTKDVTPSLWSRVRSVF